MRKFVSPKGNEVYFGYNNPFEKIESQIDEIEQKLNNMGIEICQPCKQCRRTFRHHECHCRDICQKCELDNEIKEIRRKEDLIYYKGILQQRCQRLLAYSPYRTSHENHGLFKFLWACFMVKVWL